MLGASLGTAGDAGPGYPSEPELLRVSQLCRVSQLSGCPCHPGTARDPLGSPCPDTALGTPGLSGHSSTLAVPHNLGALTS